MKYSTAIRDDLRKRIEEIESVDILVGIPSYNVEETIAFVIKQIGKGLNKHWSGLKSLILVSDGGSVDDTREVAKSAEVPPFIEKAVNIYRGIPGKGSAVRAILEAAEFLDARATLMLDSDLHSIRPDWLLNLINPIIKENYDYIAPYYKRYKYDATITNNIAYMLIRALYGRRVRQPIGGDFAFSPRLVRRLLYDERWGTDVARFGIDTWITTTAVKNGFKLGQARLGAKLHETKDPAKHLGPMFRQVVITTFELMEEYDNIWKNIKGSEKVNILGEDIGLEPEEFDIDLDSLVESFKYGWIQFKSLWKDILNPEDFKLLEKINEKEDLTLFNHKNWVRIVYDFAVTFHKWMRHHAKLVDTMLPLYNLRVARLYRASTDMDNDAFESLVEEAALTFEENKPYLLGRWEE
ncbi:MAG: glycosyltransferase [candidate division WOR-3 bacterium]|nr:glycosyltransferase [candidate division WOR-3 bacterium]